MIHSTSSLFLLIVCRGDDTSLKADQFDPEIHLGPSPLPPARRFTGGISRELIQRRTLPVRSGDALDQLNPE